MRTTLRLDEDVIRVARSLARAKEITLGAAVSELVRRGLQHPSTAGSVHGLPHFTVAEGAHPITLEAVKQGEDDW